MNIIEKVIMNLKIRQNEMSLNELNEICFATYQKNFNWLKMFKSKRSYDTYFELSGRDWSNNS